MRLRSSWRNSLFLGTSCQLTRQQRWGWQSLKVFVALARTTQVRASIHSKLTRPFAFFGKFGLGPKARQTPHMAMQAGLKFIIINRLSTNKHGCYEALDFRRLTALLAKQSKKPIKRTVTGQAEVHPVFLLT